MAIPDIKELLAGLNITSVVIFGLEVCFFMLPKHRLTLLIVPYMRPSNRSQSCRG